MNIAKLRILFTILFLSGATLYSGFVISEPWLANRFAQNCAGCHAPGRLNLPPKKRRCTLSCQGCHVNPNGGGLRSEYGKWTQQRWLKTFRIKKNKFDKLAPAPDFAQGYMHDSKTLKYSPKSKTAKNSKKQARRKRTKRKKRKKNKLVKKGLIPKMYSTTSLDHKEEYYDHYSNRDWKNVEAKSLKQFLSRVPVGDPYRLERVKLLTGGADLRYFFGNQTYNHVKNSPNSSVDFNLLMNVDLGVRFKPIKENLSFVFENRFSGIPGTNTGALESFNISKVRSAYILSDNLIYNSWVMAGIYRPHFGFYTPDHSSLSSKITGMDQNSNYNAIGFGTAPNVPFFNVHYIFNKPSGGDAVSTGNQTHVFNSEKGFNVNFGGRAITLGLNGKISYWNTKVEANPVKNRTEKSREMYSLSGGAKYKRLVGSLELLRWSVLTPLETAGSIITLDAKLRLWRENYFSFTTISSNTTHDGSPGSSSEFSLGLKSYLFSGVKLDLIYKTSESDYDDPGITDWDVGSYFLQVHTYF